LIWGSNRDILEFVTPKEIACIPDTEKARGDNNELAWNPEFWSAGISILSVVGNEEANSNEEWYKQYNGNKYVPPSELIVQKEIEYFNEDSEEQGNGKDSNSDNTALNWETSTACEVLGLFNRAVADAAAAKASLLFLGEFFNS